MLRGAQRLTALAFPWIREGKIPPDPEEGRRDLLVRIEVLDKEIAEADADIEREREALRRLGATAVSLGHHENTKGLARRRSAEVSRAETALSALVRGRTEFAEERAAHQATLARPPTADEPQGHLREPHLPYTPSRARGPDSCTCGPR